MNTLNRRLVRLITYAFGTVAPRRSADSGQSTVEYALVLVAVTTMVGIVIAYVAGDGGGLITALFGAAFAKMRALVGG